MVNDRGAFSIPEFCAWVRIGRTMAFGEIKAGRLTVTKCGKRSLIRVSDAEAWLQALPKSAKAA
jgi:hypothetical protein